MTARYFLFQLIALLLAATSVATPLLDMPRIARIESSGRPLAFNSSTQAAGLYQITPQCLADYNRHHPRHRYAPKQLFDPAVNHDVASWYLHRRIPSLIRSSHPTDILIAFNWGPSNFLRWKRRGALRHRLPRETRIYLARYSRPTIVPSPKRRHYRRAA